LKACRYGNKFLIDEGEQVVAAQGGVVVDLAVFVLRGCPAFPAVGLVDDVDVFLPVQLGFHLLFVFQGVEVFQEQQPGRLFGVVQFTGAAGVLPQDVVIFLNACSNIVLYFQEQKERHLPAVHGLKCPVWPRWSLSGLL
jgi:hypothetical protein